MNDKRTYWAAETDQKKLIDRAMERYQWHIALLKATGRLDRAKRLLSAYYGRGVNGASDSSRQVESGDDAVTMTHVNNIYPIMRKLVSLVFGKRPAVKPVAVNGDSESAAQTRLALALHEFYERKSGSKQMESDTVLYAYLASSWWMAHTWKSSAGAEVGYDEATKQVMFEGDVETFSMAPWRCAVDPGPADASQQKWVLFKRRVSRHELVARATDEYLKEELLKGGVTDKQMGPGGVVGSEIISGLDRLFGEEIREEDEVWLWELRHLPCPELPMGRLVKFVEPHCVVFDSYDAETAAGRKAVKYPYEELHCYEYSPENIAGTTHGHTPGFDLLALQQLHDTCTTSISTTIDRLGLPHLQSNGGGAPTPHALGAGITILETTAEQKLELVDFPALKQEVQQVAEFAVALMRQQVALNDTVMGAPPAGMPASAQALQRAQATEVSQGPQDRALNLVERVATGRLRLLKRFARTERVAQIAGTAKAWEVVNWRSEDIAGVERFEVEPINPASATFEGRQAISEQMGLTGPALFDFITTGSLDKATLSKTAAQEIVDKNAAALAKGVGLPPVDMQQSMQQGQPVFVDDGQGEYLKLLKSDPHHIAIPAYLAVLNSPQIRADQKIATAVIDVVSESVRLWTTLTIDECFAFGIPPLPTTGAPPMGDGTQPPAPGATDGTPPPTGDGTFTPTAPPEAGAVGLPKPPPNPITGEKSSELQGIA